MPMSAIGASQPPLPSPLRSPLTRSKPWLSFDRRISMAAIGVIALFIIALGALNFFEFGRVD